MRHTRHCNKNLHLLFLCQVQEESLHLGNPLDAFIILLLPIRRRAVHKPSLQLDFFIHLSTEMMQSLPCLVETVTLAQFSVD